MSALLRVEGLSAGYGQVSVLDDISMKVGEGEFVVVLGANGAGKTTTMRAISGVIPRTGVITFNGKRIDKLSPDAIVRSGIAQVPQGRGTFPELTVLENLRAGAYTRARQRGRRRYRAVVRCLPPSARTKRPTRRQPLGW